MHLPALKAVAGLPDPLVLLDGTPVTSRELWFNQRRGELALLFQHFMYGYFPPAPPKVTPRVLFEDRAWLGGDATMKEVELAFHQDAQPLRLLMGYPNKRARPAAVFAGPNFGGNHAETGHPQVAIPQGWLPARVTGTKDNRASEAGRGTRKKFDFEQAIGRGYAVATFYHGDIDPDKDDFTDGVHLCYFKHGQLAREPNDWGTIAAWAWGLMRAIDYLVTDPAIDPKRIAALGHSRNGKTALLATAFDTRIALGIAHQAGMGGSAPSRGTVGESVQDINGHFPHWFCENFRYFNSRPELLPFDQHALVSLCAPRPVLFSNAVDDEWANPAGQFEILRAATPVYRLLGVEGFEATAMPPPGRETLLPSRLGYFYRPGKHDMIAPDWKAFLDFADRWLP